MSENNPSTLVNLPIEEQPVILPQTVTEIIARAHDGA